MTTRRSLVRTPKRTRLARLVALSGVTAAALLTTAASGSSATLAGLTAGPIAAPLLTTATTSPTAAPGATTGAGPGPVAPLSTIGGERLAEDGVVVAAGVPAPPASDAVSYVVADIDTGEVLAAKAAHQPELPASTLKILTALTLLPKLDPAEVVIGTDEAAAVEGSKAGIYPGLKYSIDLVFKGMLLQSGNDAAETLALAAGGVQPTVDAMNEVAHDLRALDTVVVNPSGLDAPGQVTSAYDLALITRAALARDDFRAYITTQTADMPNVGGGTYQIQNENRFLASYAGAIGVKNGYTTLARHTFVGAAERDGRTLVVTAMKTEGRPEPTVASLMDWGFANAGAAPVGRLILPTDPLPTIAAVGPPTASDSGATPREGDEQVGAQQKGVASSSALEAGRTGRAWYERLVILGVVLAAAVVLLRARVLWRQRNRP